MAKKVILLSVLVLFCVGSLATAQEGRLTGTVKDAQGLVLPGVTITITGEKLLSPRVLVSAADGTYSVAAVPAPGDYTAVFEMPGFATFRREGIVMSPNSTVTINAQLEVATVAETITVTGESPVVDTKSTRVGANFGEEALFDVPSSTDTWGVLSQSSGVRLRAYDVGGSHKSQQSGWETYGVRGQTRAIRDGVNSTEDAGGVGLYYDYYSVEEYQISAVGADVEMGEPGTQVVMIVKSGGNNFSGTFNLDYTPSGFVGSNLDDELRARGGTSAPVLEFFEGHASMGGPMVKDVAWFYGGYSYFRIDKQISGRDPSIATDLGLFDCIFGKLTFQLGSKDKVIGYSEWQLKQKPFRGLSATVPAESAGPQSSWGWVHKAEWQRVWSDRLFSKVMLGHMGYGYPQTPVEGVDPATKPPRYDTASGNYTGAYWEGFFIGYWKPQVTGQVNYYLPDKAGSHDFKIGGEWLIDGNDYSRNGASGPIQYRDNSNLGVPANPAYGQLGNAYEIRFSSAPFTTTDRNRQINLYAQDTWAVTNRLTINIGLRLGTQHFYYLPTELTPEQDDIFPSGQIDGAEFLDWSNLAPRFGVVYDVTGEGKTVMKFHVGRYYEAGGYSAGGYANPAGTNRWTYEFLDQNGNGLYDGQQELGQRTATTGGSTTTIDDFNTGHADEFSFTFEHEVMADLGFRFTYVRKQHRNTWTEFNLFTTPQYLTNNYQYLCPGSCMEMAGQTLDMVTVPDYLAFQQDSHLSTVPADTDMNWDTFQFAADRRFRGGWFFQGSFDYQKKDEIRSVSPSTSPLTSDPIGQGYVESWLPSVGNRQPSTNWQFKFLTRYTMPYDVGIAINYRMMSGYPWAALHTATIPNVGNRSFFLENIENNRSENTHLFGIRFDKAFRISGSHEFRAWLDIFNLFNSNAETNFIMRTGSSFNRIIEYLGARTFKIGARYSF